MAANVTIHDYITPIREIIKDQSPDREERLRRLIYQARKINHRHLPRHGLDRTVDRLLEPQWRTKIKRFHPEGWKKTAEFIRKKAVKILGSVPPPEIVLFPGFGSFNGRVYKIDDKPVIAGSPDFPHCTGKNLQVLLAHEYAHFVRWRKTGIPSEDVPIFALLYEEGWAIWLSIRLLSGVDLSRIFMSNLHREINMPDPKGGYLAWCRRNLKSIALEAQKVLRSKDKKELGRFFQCQRLGDERTPIRVGYYLGFKLLEMLSEEMTPRRLLRLKPTSRDISAWLDELIDTVPGRKLHYRR